MSDCRLTQLYQLSPKSSAHPQTTPHATARAAANTALTHGCAAQSLLSHSRLRSQFHRALASSLQTPSRAPAYASADCTDNAPNDPCLAFSLLSLARRLGSRYGLHVHNHSSSLTAAREPTPHHAWPAHVPNTSVARAQHRCPPISHPHIISSRWVAGLCLSLVAGANLLVGPD